MTRLNNAGLRLGLGDGIAVTFRLTGWLASSTLCALGVLALACIAIGNFSLDGTMLQLNNLAGRFVAADGPRQAQFGHVAAWTFTSVLFVVGLLRRNGALRALLLDRGE